jgi:hypothetical protein
VSDEEKVAYNLERGITIEMVKVMQNLRKSEPDMTKEAWFLKVMTSCDKLRGLDPKKDYYQAFNMMVASFRDLTKTF